MVKNLSQLKKALVPGAEFEIVGHLREESVGQTRRITEANTASFYSVIPAEPTSKISLGNGGKGSMLDWGPASRWSFTEDGVCTQYFERTRTEDANSPRREVISFRVLENV
jgi:hypothetical protein